MQTRFEWREHSHVLKWFECQLRKVTSLKYANNAIQCKLELRL